MTENKLVTLIADRGEIIERAVVSVVDDVYFVCKEEELEAAKREQREPTCIGFRREYVLSC